MKTSRRSLLKKSLVAGLAVPIVKSMEEYALVAKEADSAMPAPSSKATLPVGKIGKAQISRLICGGNLVSGYAHSRDLIYVSPLLKKYFSDEKIMETWSVCEQHGVNTMILNPSDKRAVEVYRQYRAKGGKIQWLAQIGPSENDLTTVVKEAQDVGAVGALLVGNASDKWTRDGKVGLIGELMVIIKQHGMIAGVAGHELRTIKTVESAKCNPDFYMKTLHHTNYWSTRRPDQEKEVIDNYSVDNYWCRDPKETIAYMSEINKPWIAYKVLAAGAIHPKVGFKYAFENGADFAVVGVFDFQIAEDVAIANNVIRDTQNRDRAWFA